MKLTLCYIQGYHTWKSQGKVREEKFYEKVREKSGKKIFEVLRHFIEKFEKADLGLKTLV